MRIKMLTTQNGSPDGVSVRQYREGQVYEVPEALGRVFVRHRWASRVVPARRGKDAGAAPENKSASLSPVTPHGS